MSIEHNLHKNFFIITNRRHLTLLHIIYAFIHIKSIMKIYIMGLLYLKLNILILISFFGIYSYVILKRDVYRLWNKHETSLNVEKMGFYFPFSLKS